MELIEILASGDKSIWEKALFGLGLIALIFLFPALFWLAGKVFGYDVLNGEADRHRQIGEWEEQGRQRARTRRSRRR